MNHKNNNKLNCQNERQFSYQEIKNLLNNQVNHFLYLAQTALSKTQFDAFRKLTLAHNAKSLKTLEQDQCSKTQIYGKGGGAMSG